jgi:hypothetical protein
MTPTFQIRVKMAKIFQLVSAQDLSLVEEFWMPTLDPFQVFIN